ncbi:hypothetical protein DBP19_36155 [Streptomyces sp. CS090A]|nr:hypothetical protein DBP19_36155 [Streptomyces sp. CS090A]
MFEAPAQAAYLQAVRHGMRLGEAAVHIGVSRVVPARYAKADREFAALLDEAKVVGAKVRVENLPHDEYRYNVLKCRCVDCTRAARVGRAGRRTDATADEPPGEETAGDVHPIRLERTGVGESSTSFLLARAS